MSAIDARPRFLCRPSWDDACSGGLVQPRPSIQGRFGARRGCSELRPTLVERPIGATCNHSVTRVRHRPAPARAARQKFHHVLVLKYKNSAIHGIAAAGAPAAAGWSAHLKSDTTGSRGAHAALLLLLRACATGARCGGGRCGGESGASRGPGGGGRCLSSLALRRSPLSSPLGGKGARWARRCGRLATLFFSPRAEPGWGGVGWVVGRAGQEGSLGRCRRARVTLRRWRHRQRHR